MLRFVYSNTSVQRAKYTALTAVHVELPLQSVPTPCPLARSQML